MNGPGDIPLVNGATPERPCGLTSIIPSLGMSCRGRAEAFARRLQSKLRTLGSQSDESPTNEEDPIINGTSSNAWISPHQECVQQVTNLQPLRHEADSFFDFDCELESPGSPAEECEYSRLIETTSNTPHDCATESGYVCASPVSPESRASSNSSSDGPYFDPEISDVGEIRSIPTDYYDCDVDATKLSDSEKNSLTNGHYENNISEFLPNDSSESESLPPSQDSTTTTQSYSTFTGVSSESSNTLQDVVLHELQQQSNEYTELHNGYHHDDDEDYSIKDNNQEEISGVNDSPLENENNAEIDTKSTLPLQVITLSTPEYESPKLEETIKADSEDNIVKHLSACDTDDDDDCRPQRVRRCSSLKSGKTPPGTPGRKKIVRFADVLGLDLADVKTFLDEIPNIPKSAFEDLEVVESEPPIQLGPKADKMLMPLFQQPGGLPTFLDIVREKQVSLENAAVTDHINLTVTGSVRVRNLDFHKSVHIRYSIDNWRSFADLQANYVENSCDGFSDTFSFILFGNSMTVGQRLEIAVRFQCKGQQFWDNNYGANYCFQCLPATAPVSIKPIPPLPLQTTAAVSAITSPSVGEAWCGSFY